VEVVASLSQGRTASAQCSLFTHKSVPVIFLPPCIYIFTTLLVNPLINRMMCEERTGTVKAVLYTVTAQR